MTTAKKTPSLLRILERAYESRSATTPYEERRKQPRVQLRHPARVLMSNGSRLDVTATDISREAMQISCGDEGSRALTLGLDDITRDPPLMVIVSVQLPMTSGVEELTAICEVFIFHPREAGDARFALRFYQIEDHAQNIS